MENDSDHQISLHDIEIRLKTLESRRVGLLSRYDLTAVSLVSISTFVRIFYYISNVFSEPLNRTVNQVEHLTDIIEGIQGQFDKGIDIYGRLVKIAESNDSMQISSLAVTLDEVSARTSSLESTLEVEPREVIDVVEMRSELRRVNERLEDYREDVRGDIDQFMQIQIATVVAMFIAIIVLIVQGVVSNILRRGRGTLPNDS